MSTVDNHQEVVRFNSQKAITDPYDNGTNHDKKYREILHHAPRDQAEQDLILKLKDESPKSDWINLFVGRSKVFDKDHSPQRYNVVVPIVPRCYTTTDRDPVHAEVPPEGWIYIIRRRKSTQGPMLVELWRELKSDGKGFFQDVNLEKFKKSDHREATGQEGFRIIVPYCIDKEVHELWIAFSEVQWSWARVQSIKKDSKLREQRMHKLDLSDSLNDFENSKYDGATAAPSGGPRAQQSIKDVSGPALIYNLESAPDTFSNRLTKGLKDPIPVVYLDNPVGIAKTLGMIHQKACEDMRDYVKLLESAPGILQRDPAQSGSTKITPKQKKLLTKLGVKPHDPVRWSDSAKILNRYLYTDFPDQPPEDWTKEQKADFPKLKADAEKKFLEYRNNIDKADLDRALGTERRKDLRRNIEITKGWLTDFLRHELVSLGEDSALLQALDDHFTLSVKLQGPVAANLRRGANVPWSHLDFYDHGWRAVTDTIRYLGKHVYAHDEDLIAPAPDGWDLRKKDAGMKLLEQIADPQENLPIHWRLFPKAQGDTPAKVDRTIPVEDHEPEFKAKHFDSLTGAPFAQCMDTITKFAREFEEVVAMDDRTDRAYKQHIERVQHGIIRLINGVLQTDGSPFNVPIPDILDFKKGHQKDFQTLRRPVLFFSHAGDMVFDVVNDALDEKADWKGQADVDFQSKRGVKGLSTPDGSPYKVKHAILRRTPTAGNPSTLKVTTGLGDELTLKPEFSGPKKAKTRNYNATVFLELSDETRDGLLNRIGTNKACMKALGGLVAVVETINLVNSFQAIANNRNDDLRGERIADLFSSFGDLAGAMKDLVDDGGKSVVDDVGKTLPKVGIRANTAEQLRLRRAITVLKVIGYVGSAIDIGVTLKSLIENFRQNDDAYIGDAVMLTGYILTAAAVPLAVLIGLSAAWVTGIGLLLLLVGYLIKRFVFPEDISFEIWLVNGPFACGKRSHAYFQYQRTAQVNHLKDKDGHTVPTACTMHIFDTDWLYVDAAGKLVEASQANGPAGTNRLFQCDSRGNVYLKAGKYGGGKDPLVVERDTRIGAIGEPYSPHPLLQTQTAPSDERFDGHMPGDDPAQYLRIDKALKIAGAVSPLFGLGGAYLYDAKKRHRFALWCEIPKEAYNALMDALYRPTIISSQVKSNGKCEVCLHIDTPFQLPESRLHIELDTHGFSLKWEDFYGKAMVNPEPPQNFIVDPDNPQRRPTLDELQDGPNRYTFRLENKYHLTCELKVRMELFGKGETCLPCEPLFCDGDISTDDTGHRWIEFKKVFKTEDAS